MNPLDSALILSVTRKNKNQFCIQKKSEDENTGEIFCKHLQNEIDKVWTTEAKYMIMNEEDIC